jgi:ankyrin repeat protein
MNHLYASDIGREIERAIEAGDQEKVQQLINPENINMALSYFASNPLDYAIQFNSNIALDLIELGADVNAKCRDNTTPLHAAAHWNEPTIVQKLLEAGALTTEKDCNGCTPLDLAKCRKLVEVIKILENWQNPLEIIEPNVD